MRVTFERKGPDVDALIDKTVRDMQQATRKVARDVAKVGVKAFKAGAGVSHFAGYPLKFKAKKISTAGDQATVEFQASPVGFWVMLTWGAKPHPIRPRKGKALRAGSETFWAHVDHPGFAGTGAYTRGEAAAIRAMDDVVEDVYADALGAR